MCQTTDTSPAELGGLPFLLGRNGVKVVSRLMGLILAVVGTQMHI
ncbi:MAG: hypothetical protein GY896_06025 [Gammaproteobacteria bacterium]|nr:hypothetical protein [Gammaproteobacteria bacterium]